MVENILKLFFRFIVLNANGNQKSKGKRVKEKKRVTSVSFDAVEYKIQLVATQTFALDSYWIQTISIATKLL